MSSASNMNPRTCAVCGCWLTATYTYTSDGGWSVGEWSCPVCNPIKATRPIPAGTLTERVENHLRGQVGLPPTPTPDDGAVVLWRSADSSWHGRRYGCGVPWGDHDEDGHDLTKYTALPAAAYTALVAERDAMREACALEADRVLATWGYHDDPDSARAQVGAAIRALPVAEASEGADWWAVYDGDTPHSVVGPFRDKRDADWCAAGREGLIVRPLYAAPPAPLTHKEITMKVIEFEFSSFRTVTVVAPSVQDALRHLCDNDYFYDEGDDESVGWIALADDAEITVSFADDDPEPSERNMPDAEWIEDKRTLTASAASWASVHTATCVIGDTES